MQFSGRTRDFQEDIGYDRTCLKHGRTAEGALAT